MICVLDTLDPKSQCLVCWVVVLADAVSYDKTVAIETLRANLQEETF